MTHKHDDTLSAPKILNEENIQTIPNHRPSITNVQPTESLDPVLDSIEATSGLDLSTPITTSAVSEVNSVPQLDPIQSIQANPAMAALSMLPLEQIEYQVLQKIIYKFHNEEYDADQAFESILQHALASSLSLPQTLVDKLLPQMKLHLSHYPEISEHIMKSLLQIKVKGSDES